MMDFENIIPYLDIDVNDEAKLKSFFEREDVKGFIESKYAEFTPTQIIPPVPIEIDLDDIDTLNIDDTEVGYISGELNEVESFINQTENNMPIIPNIPDDEDTLSRIRKLFESSKDDDFSKKLKNKFIQLPNGKVNQPYSYLFDITTLDIPDIGEFWFEELEDNGLTFNKSTELIEGIPTQAGDHKIVLKCKRNDWQEGYPIFERTITLIVNPDPRTLWNNIPTPTDIDYFRSDSDQKYVKVDTTLGFLGFGKKERRDIVAASQRGRSHAHEGIARDDDFDISFHPDIDWYIMIAADGAGSAKYSREGAHIACSTVSDVCKSLLSINVDDLDSLIKDFNKENSETKRKKLGDALYNIIGSAVFKAYKNIEKEAENKDATMKDYSTTLLVTITKRFKFGWFVASFWVGDGGIGIYNKDTQFLKIMGESDGGEFAGQTRFLTMPEIMQPTEIYRRLRFDIVEDFTSIILMTDGVTDPKFETDSNLLKVEKWNALWTDITSSVDLVDDNEESADQLLKWLDFWSPGNHDDRTIVILY